MKATIVVLIAQHPQDGILIMGFLKEKLKT
jgi:hypothetical protein